MDLNVEQKLEQKLTPQMVQSLKILQMNLAELRECMEQEAMENPMLELTDAGRSAAAEAVPLGERRGGNALGGEAAENAIEAVAAPQGEDLYDYLHSQIDFRALTPELRGAVEAVLTGLNEDGYLDESREELSRRSGQGVRAIAAAEELVRSLEPAGVGARTLSECLELQLLRQGKGGLPLVIVREYLDDMAQHRYHRIAERTGESAARVRAACRTIRALSPRPGALLAPDGQPVYILPDLSVVREDGRLRITALRRTPEASISAVYEQLMREEQDAEVRQYLREKRRRAEMLIQSVQQRAQTLETCAVCIVAHQQAFFDGGSLRPLTMRQVADETGVHESTVSRAVRGKYLQCDRGAYPLSYFFTRSLPASPGNDKSAAAARDAIRALLCAEDGKKPLSDRKIAEALAADGIVLSRRTVAKYRAEMNIPPMSGRRRSE